MEERKIKRGKEREADVKSSHDILGEAPSSTLEAEALLQSLCSSMRSKNFDLVTLPSMMRTYLLSLRLLGINDEWPQYELKGYETMADLPKYRNILCDTTYYDAKSSNKLETTRERWKIDEGLLFVINNLDNGWSVGDIYLPRKRIGGRTMSVKKSISVDEWELRGMIEEITEELFDRASKTMVTARFGSAIDTIFRDYQRGVNNMLFNLEIQGHLDTAYRNLKGGNEASWRAAALACRNVLLDLSKKLWRAKEDTYNALSSSDGKPMSVKADKERNRLRAYMHVKGLHSDDVPVVLLDSVYAQASAAKGKCSYEDARSVLIVTYLFLAELMRQTDMQPVSKIVLAKK